MEKNKKKYHYYSGNFNNISKLRSLTGNTRHAQLLDQFAFWSINSTFKLPKESESDRWFCVMYKDIGERVGYSERSINSLIQKFTHLNLIEKKLILINNERRACLRVTDKTLSTLELITKEKTIEQTSKALEAKNKEETSRKNLNPNCTSSNAKIASPIYKEKKEIPISNITICKETIGNNPAPIPSALDIPNEYQSICNEVGELLTDREKNYVISMLENTFSQHNVKHSGDKGELFAEITFSILNKEHMPFAEKFEHRVNIIAKKLRQKQWKTPKGFSKYWDIGREITQKRQARLTKAHAEKVNSAVEDSHSILAKAVSGTKQDHRLSTENAIDRFQHGFEGGQYQWKIEKDLTEFKKEKASILVKMRTIQSEIKLLNSLIDNPQFEQQKTQHVAKVNDYKEQLTTFNNELWAIETKMKALLDAPVKETYSEEGEGGYRALYEEAC